MRKMAERLVGKQQQYANQGPFQHGYGDSFKSYNGQKSKPDGKVKVDYMPPKTSSKNGAQTAGEFVDFEEVK